MKSRNSSIRTLVIFGALTVLTGCAGLNDSYDPYYGNSRPAPYGGGYYGGGYSDPYQDRRERERLERERERLEEERERLERERDRYDTSRQPILRPPMPPPPAYDRCPSGFSPSENKCSNAERARGCKDMRLPSGLGCVNR